MSKARKTVLPRLIVTQLTDESDLAAKRILLPEDQCYYIKPDEELNSLDSYRTALGGPCGRFNCYPVVQDPDGTPWAEANMYILLRLIDSAEPDMGTYDNIAADLTKFRRYLLDHGVNWVDFPKYKQRRPTYLYRSHLLLEVRSRRLPASTATRQMGSVVGFYRWLTESRDKSPPILAPENAPWSSRERYIQLSTPYGKQSLMAVETTDVSINIPQQNDPYSDTIDDEGKLRPLTKEEQGWLIDGLVAQGNYEMLLMHLCGLTCGARIQTIATFRLRHFFEALDGSDSDEVRIPIGPGTDIDTKNDKKLVLHIPMWVYRMLSVYAHSPTAQRRRSRALGGDHPNQFLFLSKQGSPFYQCKEQRRAFDPTNELRYLRKAQAVGQYRRQYLLPLLQQSHPGFHFRFHDTRASFGMNLTDAQLNLVARGDVSLNDARVFVSTRMGHSSTETTDRYLNFRWSRKFVRDVNSKWDGHLRKLMEQVNRGDE